MKTCSQCSSTAIFKSSAGAKCLACGHVEAKPDPKQTWPPNRIINPGSLTNVMRSRPEFAPLAAVSTRGALA